MVGETGTPNLIGICLLIISPNKWVEGKLNKHYPQTSYFGIPKPGFGYTYPVLPPLVLALPLFEKVKTPRIVYLMTKLLYVAGL